MAITERDANDKTLYDLLYELCRKAGLDDNQAVNIALQMQGDVHRSISRAGGDVDAIPDEEE